MDAFTPHRDLDQEFQSHLEMAVQDRVDRGESLEQAMRLPGAWKHVWAHPVPGDWLEPAASV